jgi:hypothetical protein
MDAWFHTCTDPARDGRREAVYGKGQRNMTGSESRGMKNFAGGIE